METSIDPATLSVSGYSYPTPPPMPQEGQSTSSSRSTEPPRKKRKAWGQPVPEIKQILPPRKRAKTAEEKEQRKNERILRNRRAADKSRQRQKAAVADLEVKTNHIERENAMLRQVLARYQQRFGVPDDLQVPLSSSTEPTDPLSAPSPYTLNDDEPETPTDSLAYGTPGPESEPTLVMTDSATSVNHDSPVLAPTLDLADRQNQAETSQAGYDSMSAPSPSVMTQYPAVSDGGWTVSAMSAPFPCFSAWPQPATPNDPVLDDLSDVLDFNALANVPDLPNLGTEIGHEFTGADFPFHPEQFPPHSFFDFDAFDNQSPGGLPHETSEPTSCLQPSHGASLVDSDRPGFAASG